MNSDPQMVDVADVPLDELLSLEGTSALDAALHRIARLAEQRTVSAFNSAIEGQSWLPD